MIAADTCVVIDFFQGKDTASTRALRWTMECNTLTLPPLVLAELFSNPSALKEAKTIAASVVLLEILPGYWQRAGLLRAKIRKMGLKANIGDALIAQSCIDHVVPLLTTDKDFRHYVNAGGLALAL